MWFESYGFKENPFDIRPHPEKFVGRVSELKKIKESIHSGNITAVVGYAGNGKTTMLKLLAGELGTDFNMVYHDCSQAPASEFSMTKLMTKPRRLLGLLDGGAYSSKDKVVLLCDEIQKLDEDKTEEIKAFFDSGVLKAVVFSTIDYANIVDSMKHRISDTIELPKFSSDDLIELIKKRMDGGFTRFTSQALHELAVRSDLNARNVLKNAEKICLELHETHNKEHSINSNTIASIIGKHSHALAELDKRVPVELSPTSTLVRILKESNEKIAENTRSLEINELESRMSPLQWSIVTCLSDSNKPMTYEQIAEQTGKTKGSIAKQLSRLALVSDVHIMSKKGLTEPVG